MNRTAVTAFMLFLLLLAVAVVSAQVGDAPPADTGEVTAHTQSLASAFFICRSTTIGPDGKEITGVQWLGSILIWFLMALSAGSLGLIGSIAWNHRRSVLLPADFIDKAGNLLKNEKYKELLQETGNNRSYFAAVLNAGMRETAHGYEAMLNAVEQAADAETTSRLRTLEPLNVLGNIAPMIGLFGTVYGMILAFQTIVASGGTPDPRLLAAGIGTALTTTFWGLIVAIPALSGYAILRNKVDALAAEADFLILEMINGFRPVNK